MSRAMLLALALLGSPSWIAAQQLDSLPDAPAAPAPRGHVLRWWHGAAAAGALSTLMILDHPVQRYARHNSGTGEDNAAAHLRSLTVGHEVIVPVTKGKLDFGPWQQVYYAEFDGQRSKRVIIKAMGE